VREEKQQKKQTNKKNIYSRHDEGIEKWGTGKSGMKTSPVALFFYACFSLSDTCIKNNKINWCSLLDSTVKKA